MMTLLFGAAYAQDTLRMSLQDCVQYALSHSAEVRVQEADNRDAHLSRREAILAAFTPSVSGSTYAYSNFGRSIDPETNTYSTTTSFHNGYSLSAGITLFNGFRAVNNLKITKIQEQMGLTKTQQLTDRIRLATMEAYCNVLYFTEMEKVIRAQLETAEKALRVAERQEELGQKSRSEVLQIAADLSDRKYQLTVCENRLQDAYITLKDIMLYNEDRPMSVIREWPEELEGVMETDVSDTAVLRAVGRLPQVIIADGECQTARLSLRTARWQLLPSLSLYGGWSSSYFTYPSRTDYVTTPYGQQILNNGGASVQLSVSIPIYDRLSQQTYIARRRNALDRAEAQRDKTVLEAEAEVRRALADRDGAAEALRQAREHAALQDELFALNVRQFEQGLLSALDYQRVADNHLNATAELLNARLQLFVKTWVVRYYFGMMNVE